MQAPDFAPWANGLSADDLAAALGAVGVIHAGRNYNFPFYDDQAKVIDELTRIFKDLEVSKGILGWQEPTFLSYPNFNTRIKALSLAEAWKIVAGPGFYQIRLEMHLEQINLLSWYIEKLVRPQVKIFSAYSYLKPLSPYLDWRWPLHIAFFQNTNGKLMASQFKEWLETQDWAKPLIELVDPFVNQSAVNFLVIPDHAEVVPDLKNSPPMLANCIIEPGVNLEEIESVTNDFTLLRQATQAKAFVLSEVNPANFTRWMDELIFRLSHNNPLDRVLSEMNRPGEPPSYLFGSRFFMQASLLSSMVDRLKEELAREPAKLVDYTPQNEYLDFAAGVPSAVSYQRAMQDLDDINYDHEHEGAATISKLSKISQTMAKPPQTGQPRFLQHQLDDLSQPLISDITRFIPGDNYLLRIRIGPPEAGWPSVDQPFPDDQLPQTDSGHILTVVFTEPNHFHEPKVAAIFYPAAGPSSIAEFPFTVSEEHSTFEGRIIILYENRILQTALLHAPVSKEPALNAEDKVVFDLEGVVRSPDQDLSGRKRFNAAFLFNQTSTGEHKVTVVSNQVAYQFDLTDLYDTVSAITSMFNASKWSKKDYGQLTSDDTLVLLSQLAQNGYLLYSTLDYAGALPPSLTKSDPIQVVMVHENDYFPIEFMYQRSTPPKSTARLCPHWQANLTEGLVCSGACGPDESTQDEYICPTAFWGLSRVIEWQRYPSHDAATGTCEPIPGNDILPPLAKVLFGVSAKVPQGRVTKFKDFMDDELGVPNFQAGSWKEWVEKIQVETPETLVLMVHTLDDNGKPNMELAAQTRDPANILQRDVDFNGNLHPLVLLLGCGTHQAKVPAYNLAAQFRRNKAGVVVSTIAELFVDHAPLLAQAILKELAKKDPQNQRTIGDVILKVKQQSLLDGLPIALALLTYGDADWKV